MFAYRRGVVVARFDYNGHSYGLGVWSEQRTVSTLFCILGKKRISSIIHLGTLFGDVVQKRKTMSN